MRPPFASSHARSTTRARSLLTPLAWLTLAMLGGCAGESVQDAGAELDAPRTDTAALDAGASDTGPGDTGQVEDTGLGDAAVEDTGPGDTGPDDAGVSDAGMSDAGTSDAGTCPDDLQRCDAAMHVACAQRACDDGTYTCASIDGVWDWRVSTACDDGDACTYDDTCSAGVCTGMTLACDAMDTACVDYACNGDATCSATPRTGAACDDGDPLTVGETCDAAGACAGGTPVCTMPAAACTDGTENRNGCSQARVIGRATAGGVAGALINANTCSAGTAFDSSTCANDGGPDHAYRIWMRAGETITVGLRRTSDCTTGATPTWRPSLQLFEATGCGAPTCGAGIWCRRQTSDFLTHEYTAAQDGWVVVVVDGVNSDEGAYRLQVQLTGCAAAGCGC